MSMSVVAKNMQIKQIKPNSVLIDPQKEYNWSPKISKREKE